MLVEDHDAARGWACAHRLEQAGYRTAVCGGPEANGGPCPLVRGERCEAAERADAVVSFLRPRQPTERDALLALRRLRPALPVLVELPRRERADTVDLGVAALDAPVTVPRLLRAVAMATGDADPS